MILEDAATTFSMSTVSPAETYKRKLVDRSRLKKSTKCPYISIALAIRFRKNNEGKQKENQENFEHVSPTFHSKLQFCVDEHNKVRIFYAYVLNVRVFHHPWPTLKNCNFPNCLVPLNSIETGRIVLYFSTLSM